MAISYREEALPPVSTFPFDINRWGGVNKIKGGQQDHEMADCKNMSSRNYPYASPRKPREKLIDEAGIKRIYKVEGNRIYYIDADDYLCYCEKDEKCFVTDSDGNQIQMQNVTCTNNYDKCSVFYPNMEYIDEENKIKMPEHKFKFGNVFTQKTKMGVIWYTYSSGQTNVANANAKKVTVTVTLPVEFDGNGSPIADEDYGYPYAINNVHIQLYCMVTDADGVNKAKINIKDSTTSHADITGRVNTYEFVIPDDVVLEDTDIINIDLSVSSSNTYTDSERKTQAAYIKDGEWKYVCENIEESIFMYSFDYGVVYNNRLVCVTKNDIRASA